jgi:hypothetical protein
MQTTLQASSSPVEKGRILPAGQPDFREKFNRAPFQFAHSLVGHPLFELPRMAKLAETLLAVEGPTAVRWKSNKTTPDAKWDQLPPSEQIASVSEAIATLDQSGSGVVLYRVQQDPEYMAVLDQAIDEMEVMLERPLRPDVSWKDCYIFMTSPNGVTPYHIDHGATCLMQVHGNRKAHLWHQDDRSILTDQEIEGFYMGDLGAANYSVDMEPKAFVYDMAPGVGVHHPSLAPHHYKNGDTYSVAVGIHLFLKPSDLKARAFQANALLRQMGLKPSSVGNSPWRDDMKINTVRMFDMRKPTNKGDLIRSGAARLNKPFRVVRKLGKMLKRG